MCGERVETPVTPPAPLTTPAEHVLPSVDDDIASVAAVHLDGEANVPNPIAAKVLVEHLFARGNAKIAGVDYAVGYQLAHGYTGGDIVDVYQFDNNAVALSVADISGKGTEAAIHAALVKYGLRAYASQGLTPERVLRSMDRLYIENNAFEKIESFASVFFGMVDDSRRIMHYASGGHEAALIVVPGERAQVLAPTAPLVGVFDDQHHLFKQSYVELPPGTLFVATTDGLTDARAPDRSFFGLDLVIDTVEALAEAPTATIVAELIERARAFSNDNLRDDVAVLVARFP